MKNPSNFIPATSPRPSLFSPEVLWQPLRSWHSGVFAGEKKDRVSGDGSGCVRMVDGLPSCSPPLTVTHRHYWLKDEPAKNLSSFLSYPGGMGYYGSGLGDELYFWEIYPSESGDVERFGNEEEMEKEVCRLLLKPDLRYLELP